MKNILISAIILLMVCACTKRANPYKYRHKPKAGVHYPINNNSSYLKTDKNTL